MTNRFSFKIIIRNASFNLLGSLIPLIIALLTIPILLGKLGTDKFGILNLAWIVIGYFGFFDLGIGRALTKIVSEKIGKNQPSEIPAYFWTSIFLMFGFSSIVSVGLYFLSEKLIFNFFKIPAELHQETIKSFHLLILAIPIVTMSAGIRGLLEAYQRFDIVNIIRTFLGMSSFLAPVLVLIFTNDLYWIVLFLVLIRLLFWLTYFLSAFFINRELLINFKLNFHLIKSIFQLSSWMTLSNITVPIITYSDRILVASLISATALTYYSTPYEIITKLLIIPGALTSVLFPTFAANYFIDRISTIKLFDKAMKYIALLLFPIIAIIVIFSFDFLKIWLGEEFASHSYIILQFLSFGIFFNSIAFIPFSFIEGIGRPDITAKTQLIELPIYLFLLWIIINEYGIYGASVVYMIRMIIDLFLLTYFSKKIVGQKINYRINTKTIFLFTFILFLFVIVNNEIIIIRLLLSLVYMAFFVIFSWKYLLDEDDKDYLKSKLKFCI